MKSFFHIYFFLLVSAISVPLFAVNPSAKEVSSNVTKDAKRAAGGLVSSLVGKTTELKNSIVRSVGSVKTSVVAWVKSHPYLVGFSCGVGTIAMLAALYKHSKCFRRMIGAEELADDEFSCDIYLPNEEAFVSN